MKQKKTLFISGIISSFRKLKRYNHEIEWEKSESGIYNGDACVKIEETIDGDFIKWSDIEILLNDLENYERQRFTLEKDTVEHVTA